MPYRGGEAGNAGAAGHHPPTPAAAPAPPTQKEEEEATALCATPHDRKGGKLTSRWGGN
jgi:hypothetical protein